MDFRRFLLPCRKLKEEGGISLRAGNIGRDGWGRSKGKRICPSIKEKRKGNRTLIVHL